MAGDMSVRGADDLAALGKRLKGQDKALRRDLSAGIRSAAKPATDRATQRLADTAPGGALESSIRKQRSSVRVTTAANTAGVRVGAGKKGSGMRMLDRKGQVRHLVFGRPGSWVTQQVPGAKGKWEQSLLSERKTVQRDVLAAMETFAKRLARG